MVFKIIIGYIKVQNKMSITGSTSKVILTSCAVEAYHIIAGFTLPLPFAFHVAQFTFPKESRINFHSMTTCAVKRPSKKYESNN